MNNIPSDADTESEDIKTIYFEDQVLDFDFHPTKRYLVSSLVSGQIFGHTYSSQFDDPPEEVNIWDNNQESCRGVRFTLSGDDIVAIYKDASWIRLNSETFQQVQIQEESHSVGLNSLCVIDHNVIATGDEDGIVKLWDVREKSSIAKFNEHEDYITDMSYVHHKRSLVSVGGDGYLSVYDLRKKALLARSDQQEEELLSISVIKNGKKLLVGTQEGILSIWDWGSFGDMSDRMKGHQLSVDSICKIDEDTVCTGCSDGNIRVVGILPNKIKGILGTHKDMPVDKVKGDPFNEYVVSCSQDYTMTFWDAKELFETGNLPDDPKKKIVLPEPKPAPVDSDDSEIEDENENENDYISEDESDSDIESGSEELDGEENSFEDHGSPANLDGFINDLSNTDNVASGQSDDDFDSDSDLDESNKKKDSSKRKKKEKKPSKTKQAKKMKQFFSDL